MPSREGGQSPIACITEAGGCGREVDPPGEHDPSTCDACINGATRFFPADWHSDRVQLYVDADTDEGVRLFREVAADIEHYFIFQRPVDGRLCALFVFETYLARAVLPSVFYLGIGGPMSTGKTTLLEILKDLCWNGAISGDMKVAALTRFIDRGCTILADEADQMEDEQRDIIYGSARRGYRRGSTRILSVPVGKEWEPKAINIYGCYGFSFYNDADVDPALLSRMVKFEVVRLRTDQVAEHVFRNMARAILGQGHLKNRIAAFVEERLKQWTPERAANRILDPAFQKRVMGATTITDIARDIELASVMMLVSDIIGVDFVEEMRTVFGPDARLVDEGSVELLEDLRDIVREWADATDRKGTAIKSREGEIRVRFEDIRHEWNRRLKSAGDRTLDAPNFRKMLVGLGLRPGYELIHPKNRQYIVWTPNLDQKISGQPSPEAKTGLTQFFAHPNPQKDDLTHGLTGLGGREGRLGRILNTVRVAVRPTDGSAPIPGGALTLDAILAAVGLADPPFTLAEIEAAITRLKIRGDLIEPRLGEYAPV